MRRADRLLLIIQALRRKGGPMTAQALADDLEVSVRTIYRDMLDLQANRVPIEGAAGIGYVLRPGYDLPPLMFTVEEIEAIVLGVRLAGGRGDPALARAADDVLAKVRAVLPGPLAATMARSALIVPSGAVADRALGGQLALLRQVVRNRSCLRIRYTDKAGAQSDRVIWPLALLFFANVTLLGAWCQLRQDYRFFRTDRIACAVPTGERFASRNGALRDELMARHETGG